MLKVNGVMPEMGLMFDKPTEAQSQVLIDACGAFVTGPNYPREGYVLYRSVGQGSNIRSINLHELIAMAWRAGAKAARTE